MLVATVSEYKNLPFLVDIVFTNFKMFVYVYFV